MKKHCVNKIYYITEVVGNKKYNSYLNIEII